ncbi:MAG: precorrin-6A synthase (deacetylating) [Hyphomicrobiales bacterium]|nr:MAG: precorrin-6A synthase (deacetylating) [Hyphomicrobiales bacterium]
MHKILVIGIGAGNPDYLTLQAVKALNRVDVFFIPDKGAEKSELRALREEICARFIEAPDFRTVEFDVPARRISDTDYTGSVDHWRQQVEDVCAALLERELQPGQVGGFLVWGDPSLYDGTMRVLDALNGRGIGIEYEVIPGISAPQALAARHRVALNRVGEPVLVTTGRRLAAGEGADIPNVVVMLDTADAHRAGGDAEIFWGAYLGMPGEVLIAGPLDETADAIAAARKAGREQHGWIMDTYLLRRRT